MNNNSSDKNNKQSRRANNDSTDEINRLDSDENNKPEAAVINVNLPPPAMNGHLQCKPSRPSK